MTVELESPPSTEVIAVGDSGSEGFHPNRDSTPFDGELTTTREFLPSLTVVERDELAVTVVPSLVTSQTGPLVVTALGMTVVPGGQPAAVAG